MVLLAENLISKLVKSTKNQIVFTILRLIWYQTECRLVPNESENGKYNQNLVQIKKRFRKGLLVCAVRKRLGLEMTRIMRDHLVARLETKRNTLIHQGPTQEHRPLSIQFNSICIETLDTLYNRVRINTIINALQ